ncbi:MAG: beta-ketoacyl synthase N-terminal-like domain-containing protein [Gemmataceae bacterium]
MPVISREVPRIAIVGLGGIFPRAGTLDQFWGNIRAGVDAAREPPPGRWILPAADALAPEGPAPDRVYSTRACFIEGFRLDPDGLELEPSLLAELDPAFHLLLHAGRQAWRDGQTSRLDRQRVGVIVGNIVLPTEGASALARRVLGRTFLELLAAKLDQGGPLYRDEPASPWNRYVAGLPAGLLAQALGLGGGAFTLDAACASSLYAVKLAVDALQAGRADAMLAGGLSRPDSLYTQMGFAQLRALSARGRCAPFDAHGDGLVVGEGSGIVLLKRLDDALRDEDRIHAVIAGIGLSNDRHGRLLAPSSEGQLRAMHAAYVRAGWQPETVDLIECHATGTPVGDAVELESLRTLWGPTGWRPGQCVIGGVKSNIGHTLTAAGSAGLLKVLLAMRHETLPATANFRQPAPLLSAGPTPFRVLAASEPWPRRAADIPRRAAISAFGFGGINAHLLIEEWLPARPVAHAGIPANKPDTHCDIAIVGIGVRVGPWQGTQSFQERSFGKVDGHQPVPPRRWWGVEQSRWFRDQQGSPPAGYYLEQISVPAGRFRIPPKELEEMLPQQLLMLEAAADAIADCRWDEERLLDTGTFIGIGIDLNTTNFQLRWWLLEEARRWNRELSLNLNERMLADWVEEMREAIGPALSANRTMGALGGIVASRLAREFRIGGPSFTLSSEETSGLRGLEVACRLLQQGDIDQALVGAVDLAGDVRAVLNNQASKGPPADGAVAFVVKRLDDAVRAGDRVYAIVRGLGAGNSAERAAARAHADANNTSSLPSLPASGEFDAGAASALLEVARAALSLHHQILPGPRYWLRNRADGPRRLTVGADSIDGNHLHAILEEHAEASRPRFPLGRRAEGLFVAEGDTAEEILAQLEELTVFANGQLEASGHDLARAWHRSLDPKKRLGLAIVARSPRELIDLIEQSVLLLQTSTPVAHDRLYFNMEPLGAAVAFVFPGSGSHFAGMGRDLACHWPELLRRQDGESEYLARQLLPDLFWDADEKRLDEDRRLLIMGQVALGTLVADLVQGFGVKPSGVIGYSLGETAGLFALRVWRDRDAMLQRMTASPLFGDELAGACLAARRHWKLREDETVDWCAGVVDVPAEKVRALLPGRERVYLLLVNTPAEAVIGGQRPQVERLVRELGCRFMPLDGVSTVHCPISREVEDAYRELHLLTTHAVPGVRFYSGAWGKPYEPTRERAAASIVDQALHGMDFPALIERAYADGLRIFLEMGPGSTCSRMIGRILAGRPHLARAACVQGQESPATILRLLASLVAERVPVNLDALYEVNESSTESTAGPHVVVPVGGATFTVPQPPARESFTPSRSPTVDSEPPATTTANWENSTLPMEECDRQVAARPPRTERSDVSSGSILTPLLDANEARADAHDAFLRFAGNLVQSYQQQLSAQMALLADSPDTPITVPARPSRPDAFLDREQCLEFARGSIGRVLGADFAHVDAFPTRVRLPDEPLMLVDRIMSVAGAPGSLTAGRVVTEHDVLPGNWYLDNGVIPTCIAVEAGQADLFLSGYLGIDSRTRGLACYRLLDAVVTFHRGLPGPGSIIHYDIHIDSFFRQGETFLFRFRFEGTVNGQPLLTMRDGCAGFFTSEELSAGKGIVQTALDKQPRPGKRPADWNDFIPMAVEAYSDEQIARLRGGDLPGCFGPRFAGLKLQHPLTLPGGLMTLVHRVTLLDPNGGRFGLGLIRGEADIHPDDWFLTCHFVDDRVMPGTLMYECCLHTLRVFLLRMGWVGEAADVVCEPVPGVASRLKCRGQVIETTRTATYEIVLKELGYRPEPYVICDALMYADGKPIVEITDMSLRLTGLTRERIAEVWRATETREDATRHGDAATGRGGETEGVITQLVGSQQVSASPRLRVSASSPATSSSRPAHFDTDRILAFAIGKPSVAFGEPYRIFDEERVIARLPGPPYQFLDRIVQVEAEPWKVQSGGVIEAEYDVPPDAWYFAAERQGTMPFAVLLEVALQPCGWLAAYMGSALTSPIDLSFRNLGGSATQHRVVTPDTGTLTTRVKVTKVAGSGGMLIQHYDYDVHDERGPVYTGNTYFGFFTKQALAQQIGVREAKWFEASSSAQPVEFPSHYPFPDKMLRMVDRIDVLESAGGLHGLGYITGTMEVDPSAWFFKAHFYQDPVCPGSLGLEALYQLMKVFAVERWGAGRFQNPVLGNEHHWLYRGQVIPTNRQVTVQAMITAIDDETRMLRANGLLAVDGLIIYQMTDFTLGMG